eukprot:SAG25_NODE_8789_length_404_cov_0.813115_1_plen_37_part_10
MIDPVICTHTRINDGSAPPTSSLLSARPVQDRDRSRD